MSDPLVSIVIPTWNRCAMVAGAIDSALAQEGAAVEVIVVDDGSTDGTAKSLAERYGSDPRVRLLTQSKRGVSAARNLGLAEASAPYVAFLDSDDLLLPGFARSQAACLAAHPGADVAICDVAYRDEADGLLGTMTTHPGYRPPASLQAMLEGAWALVTSMLVRTPVARALGFREDFPVSEDTDFQMRLLASGRPPVMNGDVLSVYRQHQGLAAASQASTDVFGRRLARWQMTREHVGQASDVKAVQRVQRYLARDIARTYEERALPQQALPFRRFLACARPLRLRAWVRLARAARAAGRATRPEAR